jgi:lactoylglutathione lyase
MPMCRFVCQQNDARIMLNLVVIRAQDIDRLGSFYAALGFRFVKHQHGKGPEHLSCTIGETVFEIYPRNKANESTVSTRLGFSVPSLANAIGVLRDINATVLAEPKDSPFGRRAVVKDFEGHKVELTEMQQDGV